MTHRPLDTPATRLFLVLLLLGVAGLALFAGDAAATTKAFRPVSKTARILVFEPRGVEPSAVEHAHVDSMTSAGITHRPVAIDRVRSALRRNDAVRVKQATASVGSKLVLQVKSCDDPNCPAPSPASTTQPIPSPTPTPSPAPPSPASMPAPAPEPTPSPDPTPAPAPTPPTCAAGAFSSTSAPAACWRPYSSASPFNTPVAANPQLASNSSQIVQSWLSTWSASNKSSSPRFTAGLADTSNDYDHPIYYSQPSDPTYTVHCAEAWGRCPIEGMQIHVPGAARPAGGTDGHMAVIDQASGWEYDFWQIQQKPAGGGTLTVSWGGRTRIDGNGLGSPATAAGFGLAAGIIRPEELAARQIDHALFMVVKCTNGTSVAPAGSDTGRSCSSMGLSNANAPAMGQHFYLDMSDAQIEALPQPAWQKTILEAMAHYGLYVGDTGGGFLKIESGSSYTSFGQTDPWAQIAKSAGISPWHDSSTGKDTYSFDLSGAVDWGAHLKVAAG